MPEQGDICGPIGQQGSRQGTAQESSEETETARSWTDGVVFVASTEKIGVDTESNFVSSPATKPSEGIGQEFCMQGSAPATAFSESRDNQEILQLSWDVGGAVVLINAPPTKVEDAGAKGSLPDMGVEEKGKA